MGESQEPYKQIGLGSLETSVLFVGFLFGGCSPDSILYFCASGLLLGFSYLLLLFFINLTLFTIVTKSSLRLQTFSYSGLLQVYVGSFGKCVFLTFLIVGLIWNVYENQYKFLIYVKYLLLRMDLYSDLATCLILIVCNIPVLILSSSKDLVKLWYLGIPSILFSIFTIGFALFYAGNETPANVWYFPTNYTNAFPIFISRGAILMNAYVIVPIIGKSAQNSSSFAYGYLYALFIYTFTSAILIFKNFDANNFDLYSKNVPNIIYFFIKIADLIGILCTNILYLQPAVFLISNFSKNTKQEFQTENKVIAAVLVCFTMAFTIACRHFENFELAYIPFDFGAFVAVSWVVYVKNYTFLTNWYLVSGFLGLLLGTFLVPVLFYSSLKLSF